MGIGETSLTPLTAFDSVRHEPVRPALFSINGQIIIQCIFEKKICNFGIFPRFHRDNRFGTAENVFVR